MRRLIICADGTWNRPDGSKVGQPKPTNVTKIARAICPVASDGTSQIVYYHEGVGTGFGPLERVLGGAFGIGLSKNIRTAYRFLVDNHNPGDEIFLFGFSRGAYTVRSLGGLIRKCGILHPRHTDKIPDAYAFYRSSVRPDDPEAVEFRKKLSAEGTVKCIGVWDTVGALGIPGRLSALTRRKHAFHDVKLSSHVKNAFHALAVDERRKPFAPTLWQAKPGADQVVEQVWFAGTHSNVGGGYEDCGLSDLAFEWMTQKASGCGLEFDADHMKEILQCSCEGTLYESLKPAFRFLGSHEREIGAPAKDDTGNQLETFESVHPSARERIRLVTAPPKGPYRPRNLLKYLERIGERV
jgi:uncharacterized protein (DUF2235 family)